MSVIKSLKWEPRWVSHLGCIEGCLKFLQHKISPGWLYGGTGHAFVLKIAARNSEAKGLESLKEIVEALGT